MRNFNIVFPVFYHERFHSFPTFFCTSRESVRCSDYFPIVLEFPFAFEVAARSLFVHPFHFLLLNRSLFFVIFLLRFFYDGDESAVSFHHQDIEKTFHQFIKRYRECILTERSKCVHLEVRGLISSRITKILTKLIT